MSNLRTVILPSAPQTSWDRLAWPSKHPADVLDYTIDCAAWLGDAQRVIEAAQVSVTPGLTVVSLTYGSTGNAQTSVILQLAAGVQQTTAQVACRLTLDDGRILNAVVALPIRANFPPGLIPFQPSAPGLTVGGNVITIGGAAITV